MTLPDAPIARKGFFATDFFTVSDQGCDFDGIEVLIRESPNRSIVGKDMQEPDGGG